MYLTMIMRKIISVFLALVILSSSIGISYNVHYCGGKIFDRNIALFIINNPGCGMEAGSRSDCETSDYTFSKRCCEDHFEFFQLKEDFNIVDTINIAAKNFIAVFSELENFFIAHSILTARNYFKYKPPLIESDILVLIQRFLI